MGGGTGRCLFLFFKQKKLTPKDGAKGSQSCSSCGQEWPRDLRSLSKEASLLPGGGAASTPGVLRPSRRDLNPTSLKDRAEGFGCLAVPETALGPIPPEEPQPTPNKLSSFSQSGPRSAEGSCALFRSVLNFPSEEPPPPLPWAWLLRSMGVSMRNGQDHPGTSALRTAAPC